jgi:O-antigen/teichoic acid export membrane protein
VTVSQALSQSRQQLRNQWQQPAYRAGYVLAGGSVATAISGVAFWLLAARFYTPVTVGSNAAAVSAMLFLSGLAQLNLMNLLLRFIPGAGSAAGRLIGRCYAVGGAVSALAAAAFLMGLRRWAPELHTLLSPPAVAASFLVGTVVWSIFVMQASSLIALSRPGVSTVVHQAFNLVKLMLLGVFVVVLPASGVWFAWSGAAALATAVGAWFMFRRALPEFVRAAGGAAGAQPEPSADTNLANLARFAVPDYVAAMAWMAATSLVPVMVLALSDASHAAVFSLVWSCCLVLYGLPAAFGQSLVVHGVREPLRLQERHRHLLNASLAVLTPVVGLLVFFPEQALIPFGTWYADHGQQTLQLLALSALPNAVVALEVSRARVLRRMREVMAAMLGVCVLVVGLTWVLVPRVGIVGTGWAWLVAQLVVAGAVALAHVRPVRAVRPLGTRWTAAYRRGVEVARAGGWHVVEVPRTVSDTVVLVLTGSAGGAVLKTASSTHGAAALQREGDVLGVLTGSSALGPWRTRLPSILDAGSVRGARYLLLGLVPGRPAGPDVDLATASVAIAPLHRAHTEQVRADEALVERWVTGPAERLRAVVPRGRQAQVDRMAASLRWVLGGRTLTVGWVHGDYHAGNLLVAGSGEPSGVIDWGQASSCGLPVMDLAHWALSADTSDAALGRRVADRLGRARCWTGDEQQILATAPGGMQLPGAALLLLTWLHHVDTNLAKSPRYATSPLWLRRAAYPVLDRFRHG